MLSYFLAHLCTHTMTFLSFQGTPKHSLSLVEDHQFSTESISPHFSKYEKECSYLGNNHEIKLFLLRNFGITCILWDS